MRDGRRKQKRMDKREEGRFFVIETGRGRGAEMKYTYMTASNGDKYMKESSQTRRAREKEREGERERKRKREKDEDVVQ